MSYHWTHNIPTRTGHRDGWTLLVNGEPRFGFPIYYFFESRQQAREEAWRQKKNNSQIITCKVVRCRQIVLWGKP